ncbi:hypothetical protein C6X71_16005 [Escherichia coli]|nr:hypothetical protein DV870_12010 [Escherichia coli]PSS89270.1 hypothetical protein B2J75_17875 [Escherichia coli]PST11371.1 hypothetical protein C6X71_16005 [Escherichia coli]BDY56090.1 hypothetical protein MUTS5_45640 [Escherichia coli]HAJ2691352.1 hypothetical protein [Escherichia coli]
MKAAMCQKQSCKMYCLNERGAPQGLVFRHPHRIITADGLTLVYVRSEGDSIERVALALAD